MFLLTCILSIYACSDTEDSQDIVIGGEALEMHYNCEPFTSPFQSALELIGEWDLCAYACGFCDPTRIDTPQVRLLFKDDGTGETSYESTDFSEELTFTWEVEVDSVNQTVYVSSQPIVGYVNGLQVCEGQISLSGAPYDGPTFVFCK